MADMVPRMDEGFPPMTRFSEIEDVFAFRVNPPERSVISECGDIHGFRQLTFLVLQPLGFRFFSGNVLFELFVATVLTRRAILVKHLLGFAKLLS